MHRLLAGSLAVAVLLTPTLVQAQRTQRASSGQRSTAAGMPSLELGVDMVLAYSKPSGFDGTFGIVTPVDVRIGYVSSGKMSLESRLNFALNTGAGLTLISFDPGLNVLFKLGPGTGPHNLMGPYWTVGADANLISAKFSGAPANGGMVLTVNGGIGTRMAWGNSGAKRVEGFVAYSFENLNLGVPNMFSVGARVGLSLWH